MVAYNADSATLYGSLYHYPKANHQTPGAMRDVYNWDTGVYLGQIKEAAETYNVVGNMNEFGLVIGETTFGGIAELQVQSKAVIDYGSLIWITLQRSKTAREAINTIGALLSEYGYASEGESFSLADPTEAWVMEIIGKGELELGAVWVAKKVPAGHVTAHANQARITTFAQFGDEDTIFAPDTVSFAKKYGFYPTAAPDASFSFSDTFNPVSFEGARFCEARVWSFFGKVMGDDWAAQYLDYAQGYNLTNRMPLFVAPPKKLSLGDVRHRTYDIGHTT
jgi:dipeptidase